MSQVRLKNIHKLVYTLNSDLMSIKSVFQEEVDVGLILVVASGIHMMKRFWSQRSVPSKLIVIVGVMVFLAVLQVDSLPVGARGLMDLKIRNFSFFILLFGVTGLVFALALTMGRMAEEISSHEKNNRLQSLFLASVSHELRTPLGAILGFAKLLQEPSITENERLQYISIIEKTGESLTKVINDILDLSKIEAGHLEVEKFVFSLDVLLEDVTEFCKEKIHGKQVELRLVAKGPLPDLICTDRHRLQQILMDVVGNSIKFTERGEITISCETHGENLTIHVSDTGLGISPDKQCLLFQNFSRVDNSLSRRHDGTGLGLALSRRLARMLGGDVILSQSREGIGSTFTISIPFERPSKVNRTAGEVVEKANIPRPLKNKSILVVDDSAINRLLLEKILTKEGVLVNMAVNGQEAVNMARQNRYDVILMDVQMPVLDGREATQQLRSSGYNLPIIALTAHALKEDRDKCLEAGCNEYLTKPVQFEVLFSVIAKCTEPLYREVPLSLENTLVISG